MVPVFSSLSNVGRDSSLTFPLTRSSDRIARLAHAT
jgi:hypothetical protein